MTSEATAARIFTPLAFARAYAAIGWPVFPLHEAYDGGGCSCKQDCGNPGKHPRTKHGLKDATTDEAVIRAWWSQWPNSPIGIVTGHASGLLVVDLDPRSGSDATWAKLIADHDPPITMCVQTGGGGQHLYFRAPATPIKSRARALGDGIDVKAEGGYVVAPPSKHASGAQYAFAPGCGPPDMMPVECPEWIVELASRTPTKPRKPSTKDQGWLAAAFAAAGWLGERQPNGAWTAHCPWHHEHSHGRDMDSSCVVFAPSEGRTLGWWHCSHAHCSGRTQDDVKAALPEDARKTADKAFPRKPAQLPPEAHAAHASDGRADAWQEDLQRKTDGSLVACLQNVLTILAHDARWSGVLAYDAFADRMIFASPPPWHPDDAPATQARCIADEDATRLAAWCSRAWCLRIGTDLAWQALLAAARRTEVHPVQEYLARCRDAWDGKQRLASCLSTYLGAPASAYTSAIGLRWMISAVARIMPQRADGSGGAGCRADCALVLEGPQGALKSSALAVLASDAWFADDVGDLRSKDSADALRGKWIVELGELSAIKRADVELVKSYLSRRVDHYRPPYGRTTIDRARQNVFAGSTNADTYHSDPTGLRRFWAVRCGAIALQALAADRDLLWGEAAVRYEAGEQWWLTAAETPDQVIEQAKRREVDPWTSSVLSWADSTAGEITVPRVLEALDVDLARRTMADARRVGAILRAAGYVQDGTTGGRGVRREKTWRRFTCVTDNAEPSVTRDS